MLSARWSLTGTPNSYRRRKAVLSGALLALLATATAAPAAGGAQDGEKLIKKAEQAIAANRLTTPEGDNAVAYIERALVLNPNDSRAAALLDEVVARYERLVERSLDRGEQARLQSLDRAITFRDRANEVIARHGMADKAVAGMDERIAAMGKPAAGRVPVAGANTGEMLQALAEQHVTLASTFLAKQDVREAGWHSAQAEALAGRYHLSSVPGLAAIKQQLAVAKARTAEPAKATAATGPKDGDMARAHFTELAAFHIASENAARAQGDTAAAVSHRRVADELVMQYGLSEDEVRSVSAELGEPRAARPTLASRRVFGTF